jgi:hypothetical protein
MLNNKTSKAASLSPNGLITCTYMGGKSRVFAGEPNPEFFLNQSFNLEIWYHFNLQKQ